MQEATLEEAVWCHCVDPCGAGVDLGWGLVDSCGNGIDFFPASSNQWMMKVTGSAGMEGE